MDEHKNDYIIFNGLKIYENQYLWYKDNKYEGKIRVIEVARDQTAFAEVFRKKFKLFNANIEKPYPQFIACTETSRINTPRTFIVTPLQKSYVWKDKEEYEEHKNRNLLADSEENGDSLIVESCTFSDTFPMGYPVIDDPHKDEIGILAATPIIHVVNIEI